MVRITKVHTGGGDKGETSLFGGERVKKNHLSIKAYGTIDELNSWIGLIKDNMEDKETDLLISVQEQLFTIGSYLATGNNNTLVGRETGVSAADAENQLVFGKGVVGNQDNSFTFGVNTPVRIRRECCRFRTKIEGTRIVAIQFRNSSTCRVGCACHFGMQQRGIRTIKTAAPYIACLCVS